MQIRSQAKWNVIMEVTEKPLFSNSNSYGKLVLVLILSLTLKLEKHGLAFVSDRCQIHFINMFNIHAGLKNVPPDSDGTLGKLLLGKAEDAIEKNENFNEQFWSAYDGLWQEVWECCWENQTWWKWIEKVKLTNFLKIKMWHFHLSFKMSDILIKLKGPCHFPS